MHLNEDKTRQHPSEIARKKNVSLTESPSMRTRRGSTPVRLPGGKKRFTDRIPLNEDEIRNCLKLSLIAQQPQQKANKPTNETAECYWLNAPGGPSMALRSHFKLRPPKVSILVFYAQSTSTIAQNNPNKKQTNKQ